MASMDLIGVCLGAKLELCSGFWDGKSYKVCWHAACQIVIFEFSVLLKGLLWFSLVMDVSCLMEVKGSFICDQKEGVTHLSHANVFIFKITRRPHAWSSFHAFANLGTAHTSNPRMCIWNLSLMDSYSLICALFVW